jgi:hypothetical protein
MQIVAEFAAIYIKRMLKNIFAHKRVWCIWDGNEASTPYVLLFRQVKNPAACCGVLPRKKP